MTVSVLIAEDSLLLREGLLSLLSTQDDVRVLDAVGSLPELLSAVERHRPDAVITDIRMPPTNADEGIVAAEQLGATHPDVGIVVLSQYVEPEWALRLFDKGARGRAYLLKERIGDLRQLRHAIDTVVSGGTTLDPIVVDALVAARRRNEDSPLDRLTPRETEVLSLVATGMSNVAVSQELTLSERAVEKHLTSVLSKLDLPADEGHVHRRVRAVLVYLSSTRT